MPLDSPENDRQHFLNLIVVAVERAGRDSGVVAVATEAQRFLQRNPDCSMSIGDVEEQFSGAAARRGLAVKLSGNTSGGDTFGFLA